MVIYSIIELTYLIKIINYYESGLIKIIKFYTRDLKNAKHINKPRIPYWYFIKEQHPILMKKGIKFYNMMKQISENWKLLTENERSIYKNKHLEDKKRYNKEIFDFLTN